MSVEISREKIRRLGALADERGVIAAASAGQRGSLQSAIAHAKGIERDDVTDEMMRELKVAISRALTPHASAILLDPDWGLPAAEVRDPKSGLLLSYEQSGSDSDRPGRMTDLLPRMSVRRLKELGADGVNVRLHYNPFEARDVNDEKHAFVERIGAECRAEGMPLFLGLTAYDERGADRPRLELAKRKPEIVTESIRELSKERYGVDVLEVEIPINPAFAEGAGVFAGESAYTKEQALDHFRSAAEASERPFVYSSAGVSSQQFTESLHWAAEAGVNFAGVLCGRAAWAEGVAVFGQKGVAALEEWLADQGVKAFDAVNAALANAGSWYSFYGANAPESLAV
jgi:tagatose 1,6-diphosphate aldolase